MKPRSDVSHYHFLVKLPNLLLFYAHICENVLHSNESKIKENFEVLKITQSPQKLEIFHKTSTKLHKCILRNVTNLITFTYNTYIINSFQGNPLRNVCTYNPHDVAVVKVNLPILPLNTTRANAVKAPKILIGNIIAQIGSRVSPAHS